MRFRDMNQGEAFRLGFLLCALGVFGASAALAFAQLTTPAVLTFLLGAVLAGFAVFFDYEDRDAASSEAGREQGTMEAAKLVGLLQSLAIATCMQLMTLWRAPPTRGTRARRDVFILARLLDSLLAEAGLGAVERARIKTLLHRQTTLEMLLPLADRVNALIDQKCRERPGSLNNATDSQKLSADELVKLASTLDMYKTLARHISDTQCLSLAERARLCGEMAEDLADLKEWVTHQRLRRPHLWLQSVETAADAPFSGSRLSEARDVREG